MPFIDADTKRVVLQKTWCHGQAICPIYGIVILWWFVENGFQPKSLIFAGLFLPFWCYLSYRSIFVSFDYRIILIGGLLAEVSHAIVFTVAWQHLDKTIQMVLFIASMLLFIETAVFMGVVMAFRPRDHPNASNAAEISEPPSNYADVSPTYQSASSLLV